MDHNYVNPESFKDKERIDEYFKNKEKWTNGKESKSCNTLLNVFNEYMT